MLVKFQEILAEGEKKGFAIPAFNVYNLETAIGVAEAAKETGAPVIFQLYSRLFENQYARNLAPALIQITRDLPSQAAIHLDHGSDLDKVMQALNCGATGVMIDASTLPLAENIAKTKAAVEMCLHNGAGVEGELGHIGNTAEEMSEYTRADEAERYVKETGVCALAVMVGTAHGHYKQAPVIDIARIKEIREAVKIPLVLHGGSGIPDEQIRASINAGIRKINFATDVCCTFLDALFEVDRGIIGIDLFMKGPIEAVKRFAVEKIKLLGAASG